MPTALVNGVTAGAVGTAVLNTTTYLDMVLRDRPSSSVPAETVEKATDLVGVHLVHDGDDGPRGENRKQGLGALTGYLTGYAVGAAYGVLRPRYFPTVPPLLAGVGVATAATAATVLPYSALGVSDPREWSASSWAADIVPHLFFGWATATAFDALQRRSGRAGP